MKNNYLNQDEKLDIEIWDGIDITTLENDKNNIQELKKSAKEFVKKRETKMNIRISPVELEKIKQRAQQEGLKYQTFIKSVLHKYITGQLVDKNLVAS
jgi:predicted DNA binding CopG/RHH family protein